MQIRLLKLLIMLKGQKKTTEYTRGLTIAVSSMLRFRNKGHPVWKMFQSNASAFNEECGEISFSVLARGLGRGGIQSDLKVVDGRYRLVRGRMLTAAMLKEDLFTVDTADKGRTVKVECDEVQATTDHFRRVMVAIKRGCHRHYDQGLGHRSSNMDARPDVAADPCPPVFRTVTDDLDTLFEKCDDLVANWWVSRHAEVWPEAVLNSDHS
jgi:hypothetical protein